MKKTFCKLTLAIGSILVIFIGFGCGDKEKEIPTPQNSVNKYSSINNINDENSEKKNIYEYYQLLPDNIFKSLEGVKYHLQKKGTKWQTESLADYPLEPIVDIKNGFIQISDEGTGGGSLVETITLFRKADQGAIIGISIESFIGFFSYSVFSFLEYSDKTWYDVTDKVFPVNSFKEFINGKYRALYLDQNNRIFKALTLIIELPRNGTIVPISINLSQIHFLLSSEIIPQTGNKLNEKEIETLWEIVENIEYKSINCKWNKQNGNFEIGDKEIWSVTDIELLFESISEGGGNFESTAEDQIYDIILEIDEIAKEAFLIDSISNHTRSLSIIIESEPDEIKNYYQVVVGEDNGRSFVSYYHFNVYMPNYEIKVYDVLNDELLELKEWQKKQRKY